MAETIFDQILSKKIPADVVYEDDWVLAFRDVAPQAPVHVLVIPKQKLKSFVDLKKESVTNLGYYLQAISKVADQLGLEAEGYRVVFNHGKHGQQTVDYLHAHIIGGRQLQWPPG